MYKLYPSLVLGFHGCDEDVGEKVLAGKAGLKPSRNSYDWLGSGIYFWENSPDRAMEWAQLRKKREKIKKPFVVGAVIALGRCCDLLETHSLAVLREHYDALVDTFKSAEYEDQIPTNGEDLLARRLDCAVIDYMHEQLEANGAPAFDSVRGAFWEGEELYPTSGFKEKNHIQVCVRNPNCIKGYFRPREIDTKFKPV